MHDPIVIKSKEIPAMIIPTIPINKTLYNDNMVIPNSP